MTEAREKKSLNTWNGEPIPAGGSKDVTLAISESYSGVTARIPIHIRRAAEPGPVVFVSAALHGDEINGTGAIRQLIQDPELELTRGTVMLIPVLNLLAFDRHSRYLPDRRDLNRSFPGSAKGSLASRMARKIFDEIVFRADYGIDLHTAAVRRTNYPNVRGDLTNEKVKKLAFAFGCELIMNQKGPAGAFRREACAAGVPSIIMEGGEIWKVEPSIVDSAVRGVKSVLRSLEMIPGKVEQPPFQVVLEKSEWMRAERGGFLHFHFSSGDIVEKGQQLSTITTLLGKERHVVTAPFDAVVIGMTTIPAISPGDPICHLGKLPDGTSAVQLRKLREQNEWYEEQVSEDLASNVLVVEPQNGDDQS